MKIMGTTQDGFLVQCTEEELCQLVGIERDYYGVEGDKTRDSFKKKMSKEAPRKKIDWVGLVIPVADYYRSARKIAEGWNEQYEFKQAVGFLRTFAQQLEMLAGTYRPAKLDEEA